MIRIHWIRVTIESGLVLSIIILIFILMDGTAATVSILPFSIGRCCGGSSRCCCRPMRGMIWK